MDRRTILKTAVLSPLVILSQDTSYNVLGCHKPIKGTLAWCELPDGKTISFNWEPTSSKVLEWVSAVTLQIEAYAGVHKIKENDQLAISAPEWDRILIFINDDIRTKIIGVAHGRNFDDQELETIRKLSLQYFNELKLVN